MSFQSEYSGYNEYNNHVFAKDTYIPRVDQLTSNTIEKIHKKATQPPTKPVTQTAPDTQGNSKRRRTAFTSNQISTLEKAFAADTYITKVKRNELASQLNVTERILKVWFQNRRMKQKREKGENGPKYSNKRSIHSVSDQSETSSMISDASAYSNTNKNIEKIPNDGVVTNAYQNEKHGEVQNVQQHVSNSNDNKIVGSSTVHHYGGNYNGNYGDNFGYNSNYDSFFDPHIGYNFGSSFDNIFSTIGAPNYYNQPMPPMPNTAYCHPPMNIECNSDQFVGPM